MKNSTIHLVGAKIRAIRKAKGITQEQLAEQINTQHSYIGNIERGEQNITINTLEKISEALQVGISDFFEDGGFKSTSSKIWDIFEVLTDKSEEDLGRVLIILKQVFTK